MITDRITEILREPFGEVLETASLLKVERLNGESEETFRVRVARAMQRRLWPEGKEYPQRLIDRDKEYEEAAKLESYLNN